MKTIKFSHIYSKLKTNDGRYPAINARLLQVLDIDLEELSPQFLDYDTDNGLFKLPKKGNYLMLIFSGTNGLFTTLRRSTPDKRKYYRESVGDAFEVKIVPPVA